MKRRLILSAIPLAALVVALLLGQLLPEYRFWLICVAMLVGLICSLVDSVQQRREKKRSSFRRAMDALREELGL